MKFDCNMCKGICCYNPPQIANKEEYLLAKSQNVEIGAIYIKSINKYALGILKRNGKCPFLTEESKCSVYDNRFKSCREYKCGFYEKEISGPINTIDFVKSLNNHSNNFDIFLVGEKFIKNENIKILKPWEIKDAIFALDLNIFSSLMKEINKNILSQEN